MYVMEFEFQNPSLISSLISRLTDVWSPLALLLAVATAAAASFKLVLLLRRRLREGKSVISSTPSYSSDSDESDATTSDSDDEEELQEEEEEEEKSRRPSRSHEGQNSSFGWGGAVVRTWSQGRGLNRGFGFDLVDTSRGDPIRSFYVSGAEGGGGGEVSAVGMATPAVVMAAGPTAVRLWDVRGEGGDVAADAVMRRRRGGAAAGETVVVPEIRGGREVEMERWWDATDEELAGDGDDGRRRRRRRSLVSVPVVVEWCRDVVRRFPILPSPK